MATNEDEWTVVTKPKQKPLNEKRPGNYKANETVQRKYEHPMAKPTRSNIRDLSRNAVKNGRSESRNFSSSKSRDDSGSGLVPFRGDAMRERPREYKTNPRKDQDKNRRDSFQKSGNENAYTKRPGVIILPKGKTTKRSNRKKNKTDPQYLKSVNQVSLNLRDVFRDAPIAKEAKKTKISTGVAIRPQTHTYAKDRVAPRNVLDSSAPLTHRGKERVTPKRKKPTKLKRLVLEERRLLRLQRTLRKPANLEGNDMLLDVVTDEVVLPQIRVTFIDSDLNETDIKPEIESFDTKEGSDVQEIYGVVINGDDFIQEIKSKVEETSDLNKIEQDPQVVSKPEPVIAELETFQASFMGEGLPGLHTKKFREYCNQMPDKTVDEMTTKLLYELMRLQARQHDMNKIKSKGRKRLVLGFHEVTKHLKVQNLKCIVIARDLEHSRAIGGLEHQIVTICSQCNSQQVQVIFALTKSTLSFSVCKPRTIVSIVGILNYDGRQHIYKELVKLVAVKGQEYSETVRVKRKQVLNAGKLSEDILIDNRKEDEVQSEPGESVLSSNSINLQDNASTTSSGSRKKSKRNRNRQKSTEQPQSNIQIKKFELKDGEIDEFVPTKFIPPDSPYSDTYTQYLESGVEYYDYSYQPVYSPGAYLYYPYSLDPYNQQYDY